MPRPRPGRCLGGGEGKRRKDLRQGDYLVVFLAGFFAVDAGASTTPVSVLRTSALPSLTFTSISTRRLRLWPSLVALSAMGLSGPTPTVVILDAGMPESTSTLATASARALEIFLFTALLPVEDVWPLTSRVYSPS